MLVSVGHCSRGARATAPPPGAATCGWSHSRRREKIGAADPLPRLRGHLPGDDQPDRPALQALVWRLGHNRSRLRTGRGCAEFIMARSALCAPFFKVGYKAATGFVTGRAAAHYPAATGG